MVEDAGLPVPAVKKASGGNPESFYESDAVENVVEPDDALGVPLAAGTAWLFARDSFDQSLDYLFLDEAGQVSLADAIAMGTAARNVVLLGDPNQLAQVLQGTHPDGRGRLRARASARRRDDGRGGSRALPRADVPAPSGRLRLHLGRVLRRAARARPVHVGADDAVRDGAPLPRRRARGAPPGVARGGARGRGRGAGAPRRRDAARAAHRRRAVQRAGRTGSRASSTERASASAPWTSSRARRRTSFYSLASSSSEDVPRSLGFLLSRNRLNVAVSRARCLAYVVASPRLLEVDARTIEHMRLANALCRFVELAEGDVSKV